LIYQVSKFAYLNDYFIGAMLTYWNGPFAAITMENRGQSASWCGQMDDIPLLWRIMR